MIKELLLAANPGLVKREALERLEAKVDELSELLTEIEQLVFEKDSSDDE